MRSAFRLEIIMILYSVLHFAKQIIAPVSRVFWAGLVGSRDVT